MRCHRMSELTNPGARPAPSLRARAAGFPGPCWPPLTGHHPACGRPPCPARPAPRARSCSISEMGSAPAAAGNDGGRDRGDATCTEGDSAGFLTVRGWQGDGDSNARAAAASRLASLGAASHARPSVPGPSLYPGAAACDRSLSGRALARGPSGSPLGLLIPVQRRPLLGSSQKRIWRRDGDSNLCGLEASPLAGLAACVSRPPTVPGAGPSLDALTSRAPSSVARS
jgi:hypothetical protein